MGLERVGMWIWWQLAGTFWFEIVNLKEKLSYLKQFEQAPKYLVIHCWDNDIGVTYLSLHN